MAKIGIPMELPELRLEPPISGKVRLSDDMQQALSLLAAYGDHRRKLLRCSEEGILQIVSPQVKDIIHITDEDPNYEYQGSNVPCSEVLVAGHPDNTGRVWTRTNKTATVDNAWPLEAGCFFGFSIDNLDQLHLLIPTAADVAIICYTR